MNATDGHDRGGRAQLSGAFTTPRWLRDLGRSSWLLVGVLALVLGLIWLLAETYTITGPMVCALIVSVVAMPVVRLLDRHMPRVLAAGSDGFRQRIVRLLSVNLPSFDEDTAARFMRGG